MFILVRRQKARRYAFQVRSIEFRKSEIAMGCRFNLPRGRERMLLFPNIKQIKQARLGFHLQSTKDDCRGEAVQKNCF